MSRRYELIRSSGHLLGLHDILILRISLQKIKMHSKLCLEGKESCTGLFKFL